MPHCLLVQRYLNPCQIYILLGEKKIDTKPRYVSNQKAQFNERFSMKSVLMFNEQTQEYLPKPVRW